MSSRSVYRILFHYSNSRIFATDPLTLLNISWDYGYETAHVISPFPKSLELWLWAAQSCIEMSGCTVTLKKYFTNQCHQYIITETTCVNNNMIYQRVM